MVGFIPWCTDGLSTIIGQIHYLFAIVVFMDPTKLPDLKKSWLNTLICDPSILKCIFFVIKITHLANYCSTTL